MGRVEETELMRLGHPSGTRKFRLQKRKQDYTNSNQANSHCERVEECALDEDRFLHSWIESNPYFGRRSAQAVSTFVKDERLAIFVIFTGRECDYRDAWSAIDRRDAAHIS